MSKMLQDCCGCCAAEICCDQPSARAKGIAAMAAHTGQSAEVAATVYAWMEDEGLIFAPASLRPFVQDVVAAVRKAHG